MGQLNQAKALLKKTIKQLPNEPSVYNSLGNILRRQGKDKDAIVAYQKATALNPNYPGALSNLGNAYLSQEKFTEAKQSYQKAIEVDPQYPDAHFNLARLLVSEGSLDEAIKHLTTVIETIPQHGAAQGLLGNLYIEAGDYQNAAKHLSIRTTIQPHHTDSQQALGNAYIKLEQYDLAVNHLSQALAQNPALDEIEHQLATAYLMSGQRDNALRHYLRQVEHAPHLDSLYNIGVILSDQQRHSDALGYFEQLLERDPDHLSTHLNMAAIYLKQSNLQKAINHYQKALTVDPNNAETKHILHALNQDELPNQAPTEYLQNLFDQYAPGYDKHLLEILRYDVPQQIHTLVVNEVNPHDHSLRILDLGCGTGLIAEQFRSQAKEMIGVDVSASMLEAAKRKGLYQQLLNQSVEEALDNFKEIDLVIAADVFPYIGNLKEIFQKTHHVLKPNGHFAFSIEKTLENNYILQKNIRYAHSKSYIESLSSDYGFEVISANNSILRNQLQKPLEGYIFLLKSI